MEHSIQQKTQKPNLKNAFGIQINLQQKQSKLLKSSEWNPSFKNVCQFSFCTCFFCVKELDSKSRGHVQEDYNDNLFLDTIFE